MIGQPEVEFSDNSCSLTWKDQQIAIAFDMLHERSDGLHGEVTVVALVPGMIKPGHIHWARVNLASTPARKNLKDVLFAKTKDDQTTCRYDWESLIEYACTITARRYREGSPIVNLAEIPRPSKLQYLVEKLMPRGQTSVIYSRGASGKSLLAMAIATAVSEGRSLPDGLNVSGQENVLYLDYETDAQEQRLRLDYIWAARKGRPLPNVFYRQQLRPLMADAGYLRGEIRARKIGLVIVDSIAYAMAGKAMDAEVAIETFNVLRSFGNDVTRLVIAHIPKADKENKEASIFGSVFQENAGRSVWEMRSEDMTDGLAIGLYLRKKNWGKGFDPVGLRFTFHDETESVELKNYVIEDDPELASHGTLTYRLEAALRSGAKSVNALAEETGGSSESIRRTLTRLATRGKVVRIGNNGTGRGAEGHWGLTSYQDDGRF